MAKVLTEYDEHDRHPAAGTTCPSNTWTEEGPQAIGWHHEIANCSSSRPGAYAVQRQGSISILCYYDVTDAQTNVIVASYNSPQ